MKLKRFANSKIIKQSGFTESDIALIMEKGGEINSLNTIAWVDNCCAFSSKMENIFVDRLAPFWINHNDVMIRIDKDNFDENKSKIVSDEQGCNCYESCLDGLIACCEDKVTVVGVITVLNNNYYEGTSYADILVEINPDLNPLTECSKEQIINALKALRS